jgi:hypothetical protein
MDMAPDGGPCVIGYTPSFDFPTTPGCFDPTHNGGIDDVFVTKFHPSGSSLSFSTFLGSNQTDRGHDLAVDKQGAIYVTGLTWGTNFPTSADAFDKTLSGLNDAFMAVLEPDGSKLRHGTYLGGDNNDQGYGIAVDAVGDVYVAGENIFGGIALPPGAFDVTNGFIDALAVKFDFCPGTLAEHGAACPGSGGFLPHLSAFGCPKPGSTVTLRTDGALGGAPALLLFGAGTGSAPVVPGCAVQVLPLLPPVLSFVMPGSGPGGGSLVLSGALPQSIPPATVSMQVLLADQGGAFGVTATNGLSMTIGS